jgi:predicted acetyltransferase
MNLRTLSPLMALGPSKGKKEWTFLQELGRGENGFGNDAFGVHFDDFPEYLNKHMRFAHDADLPAGYVPQISYFLVEGDTILGLGKIRTRLTEALLKNGGHIAYAIHPEYRGRGYGKKLLGLLVEKAGKKGLDTVLITVDEDNLPSRKTAEANGARLMDVHEGMCRYWIEI